MRSEHKWRLFASSSLLTFTYLIIHAFTASEHKEPGRVDRYPALQCHKECYTVSRVTCPLPLPLMVVIVIIMRPSPAAVPRVPRSG